MTWGELLERRLFAPLHMHRSAYVDHDSARVDENAMEGHDEEGQPVPPRVDTSPLGPCCAVRSTLADMAQFIRAALDPSSPLAPSFARAAEPLAPAHPDEGDRTSLAWLVRPRDGLLVKNGQVAGYRVFLALLPRARTGLFVAVNSERIDIEALGRALVDALLRPTLVLDPSDHARSTVGAVPRSATPSDVRFGDGIELAGWEAPETARRGETILVRFYFRCIAPVPNDWRIFIHGDAEARDVPRLHGDHFPSNERDSTAFWRPNEWIRDEVPIPIPSDYASPSFDIWLGFYRGSVRMSAASSSRPIDRDRARGPTVRILP